MAGTLFCSLLPALPYPCNGSHPFGLLTCRWASNKSGRPKRGTGREHTSAYRQGSQGMLEVATRITVSGDEGAAKFFLPLSKELTKKKALEVKSFETS